MAPLIVGLLLIAALVIRRDNQTANRLLAVAIAGALYYHAGAKLVLSGQIPELPYLYRSTFPVALLSIPFFFLFVKAMTTPNFHWTKKDGWHLLPFAFGLLWYAAFWMFPRPEYFVGGEAFLIERYYRLIIKSVLQAVYLAAILRTLFHYEKRLRNHTATLHRVQDLWVKVLVGGASLLVLVDFLDVATGPTPLWGLHFYAISAVTLFVGFFSLYHSAAFAKEMALQGEEATAPLDRLTSEQLERYRSRLIRFLEEERPYLKQDLRLSDVAKALDIKPYALTEVIRRGLKSNFYDLINCRRVEWAGKLMKDEKYSHLSILGIAMDSGFNSKSVFNSAFKRFMNMTPSEYRKQRP